MARTSGIRARHSRSCRTADRPDCGCAKSWEAAVWDPRKRIKHRKTFRSHSEAKAWLVDSRKLLRDGRLGTPSKRTLELAGDSFIAKARTGEIRKPGGARYKPSVLRTYEGDLHRYLYPELGKVRLSELRRRDVQAVVDKLVGTDLSGSKVRNVLMPLRAIVRLAIEDDELVVNPTSNLRLPEAAKARERVATPVEAQVLLDALRLEDRPLWATAFYAGLRRGELRGLRDEDVDLDANVIHVRRGWDDVEGEIDPKSAKGARTVPVAGVLRLYLLEQRARTGRRGRDLFFGSTATRPFTPTHVRARALGAWAAAAVGAFLARTPLPVEIGPIGLHECRHTYVSLMFDAGLSLERIGDYVGHSSTYMTDRYRHLLEGHEAEAAARFDEYLSQRVIGAQRGAHPRLHALESGG